MKDECELRERLSQLKEAHSDAITEGLSDETVAIAKAKVNQLKWVLEE